MEASEHDLVDEKGNSAAAVTTHDQGRGFDVGGDSAGLPQFAGRVCVVCSMLEQG